MKITKDEARIIAIALSEYKMTTEVRVYDGYDVVNSLENRVTKFSDDKRRNGRMTMDTLADVYKRLNSLFKLD